MSWVSPAGSVVDQPVISLPVRPVVVQDTGFNKVLPTGAGILSFQTMAQAIRAIQEVEAALPAHHSLAARKIAEDYFDSDRVLKRLIEDTFAAVDK